MKTVEAMLPTPMLGPLAPSLRKLTLGTWSPQGERAGHTERSHRGVPMGQPQLNSQLLTSGYHTGQGKSIPR